MRTSSPGLTRASPETRLPLTNVPLRELTSRTLQAPASRSKTAWTRETCPSSASTMSLPVGPTDGHPVAVQLHQVGTGLAPHLEERVHLTTFAAKR